MVAKLIPPPNLDDLADVSVPLPGDQYFVYWDDATALWKCRLLTDADIPAAIARDAEVAAAVAAEAAARNAAIAAIELDDLADVSVPAPTDDYFLYWNAATSLWECRALAATDIPNLDASKITTGRFGMPRMPDGTLGFVLTGQGAGVDPVYAAGGGGGGTKIQDADADTSWDVEQAADEDKVHGKVAGVEAFLLDNTGILDLVKQSAARIRLATTQSLPSASWNIVKLDTVDFDQQTEFNLVNWRYYPKKSGKYLIAAGALFVAAQVVADIPYGLAIFKGTMPQAQFISHMPNNTSDLAMSTTDIEQINAGQYIQLRVYQNTGVNKDLCACTATFLAVCKVA